MKMLLLIIGIIVSNNIIPRIYCGIIFRPDSTEIFTPCENVPDAKFIQDIADFSKANINYQNNSVHISGEMQVIADIGPTDRIVFEAKIFKYVQNIWQPTPLYVTIEDICEAMYKEDNFVNSVWGQYITDKGKPCPAKDVIFHYEPFVAKLEYSGSLKWSGPHKITITARFIDENDQMRDFYLCSEIPGEMIAF